MEYLDERFPHPPLLPVYPVQRALSRLWITRVEREWSSRLDILMTGKGREAAIAKARKELRESIIAVAPIFAEKPFFMNEEFTLVDCCVAPILWRLKVVDITLPERTARPLLKYMQSMFDRESFRLSLTEAEIEMQD
jgi:RNA polymerase-associated protein